MNSTKITANKYYPTIIPSTAYKETQQNGPKLNYEVSIAILHPKLISIAEAFPTKKKKKNYLILWKEHAREHTTNTQKFNAKDGRCLMPRLKV